MKILELEIENFRGVEKLRFHPDKYVNVIVGPNAIGKTTILEALRLFKALLAPRYLQETAQVLQQLGVIGHLNPNVQFIGQQQSFDYSAIAREPQKPLKVGVLFSTTEPEQQFLRAHIPAAALSFVRGQMGRSEDQGAFALTQYLSSGAGKAALKQAHADAAAYFNDESKRSQLRLQLSFDPQTQSPVGGDPFAQIALGLLDQRLSPQQTMMSYFPADRALPAGEVGIQLGTADAANQVQSHLGTPSAKYSRLKQTIIQGILTNQIERTWIEGEIKTILDKLIPGKSLSAIQINQIGQIRVMISDQSSGKQFDMDGMSSGEKGIILTFLLIRQSLANGGILLLDEPELHLNPAVSKKLLAFLIENYVIPQGLQAFICTHSPEILGAAFDREDTNLYHLRSPVDLTKVLRKDQSEMFEAMRRLGASPADVLFTKGNIFVEGDHDSEILTEGFFELVSGYKIADLGGREEIEKEIENLKKAETKGDLQKINVFVFDLDRAPTNKESTKFVRVLQWGRHCVENYLIDETILFDLILEFGTRKPESRGTFAVRLKYLAMEQTTELAVRETYEKITPDNPGFRPKEIVGKSIQDIANTLVARLLTIATQTQGIDRDKWVKDFVGTASARRDELSAEWESSWIAKTDGKKLLRSLYTEFQINIDPLSFKKKIIQRMRAEKTESWQLIEAALRKALSVDGS